MADAEGYAGNGEAQESSQVRKTKKCYCRNQSPHKNEPVLVQVVGEPAGNPLQKAGGERVEGNHESNFRKRKPYFRGEEGNHHHKHSPGHGGAELEEKNDQHFMVRENPVENRPEPAESLASPTGRKVAGQETEDKDHGKDGQCRHGVERCIKTDCFGEETAQERARTHPEKKGTLEGAEKNPSFPFGATSAPMAMVMGTTMAEPMPWPILMAMRPSVVAANV